MEIWFNHWRIRINELKSNRVTFTLRKGDCPPVFLNIYPVIALVESNDHLKRMQIWFNNWRIRINELKDNRVTFTLRKGDCSPVFLNIHPVSGTK